MIHVDEMCAVVEAYIFRTKGVRVAIQLRYHPIFLSRDLSMLNYAYGVAIDS